MKDVVIIHIKNVGDSEIEEMKNFTKKINETFEGTNQKALVVFGDDIDIYDLRNQPVKTFVSESDVTTSQEKYGITRGKILPCKNDDK